MYRSNVSVITSVVLSRDNIDHKTDRMNDITDSFKRTIDDCINLYFKKNWGNLHCQRVIQLHNSLHYENMYNRLNKYIFIYLKLHICLTSQVISSYLYGSVYNVRFQFVVAEQLYTQYNSISRQQPRKYCTTIEFIIYSITIIPHHYSKKKFWRNSNYVRKKRNTTL